jgi:hypothetical protein
MLYGQALALNPTPSPTPVLLNLTGPHVLIPNRIAETTFAVAQSNPREVAWVAKIRDATLRWSLKIDWTFLQH